MFDKNNEGVSPVIGIILMVAVTVALVALAATVVFDLGTNVQQPADVSVDLTFDNSSTSGEGTIRAEVIRNNNAKQVLLRYPNGSSTDTADIVGGTASGGVGSTGVASVDVSSSADSNGTAEVVAIVEGTSNQQIVDTLQYDAG